MMRPLFVVVDVSMDRLDIFHPDRGARRIANTPEAARDFAAERLRDRGHVVCEATGG